MVLVILLNELIHVIILRSLSPQRRLYDADAGTFKLEGISKSGSSAISIHGLRISIFVFPLRRAIGGTPGR